LDGVADAAVGRCPPARYFFLYRGLDAAGNVGTARLEVAVVTRSVVTLAVTRPADGGYGSTLEDAQTLAARVADSATAENAACRAALVQQLAPIFSGVRR
jgi:aspartate oxidase